MTVDDSIYGRFEITHPLLVDLLRSEALQRLKGVSMAGVPSLLGLQTTTSRYDHSVGVMLLVCQLGGSVEEQAAALLHDASHTALSHVADVVFEADGSGAGSYHDRVQEEHLSQTEVPSICQRHGIRWQDLTREDRFSLLEQPLPRLCADRVDYFLRDAESLGALSAGDVQWLRDRLTRENGRMAIEGLDAARCFGEGFLACDRVAWSNPRHLGLYELAARCIRCALEAETLTVRDLFSTDREVWDRLQQSDALEVRRLVRQIHPSTAFILDPDDPTFTLHPKVRTVDPTVKVPKESRHKLTTLSELDPRFKKKRERHIERQSGPCPVRVVPRRSSRTQIGT